MLTPIVDPIIGSISKDTSISWIEVFKIVLNRIFISPKGETLPIESIKNIMNGPKRPFAYACYKLLGKNPTTFNTFLETYRLPVPEHYIDRLHRYIELYFQKNAEDDAYRELFACEIKHAETAVELLESRLRDDIAEYHRQEVKYTSLMIKLAIGYILIITVSNPIIDYIEPLRLRVQNIRQSYRLMDAGTLKENKEE